MESLTPADLTRLEKFAKYRIRGLGRAADGRDYEVLIQEALKLTLLGCEDLTRGRRWRKNSVTFVQHLVGAMRSISNHWANQFFGDDIFLDSEVLRDREEGDTKSALAGAASKRPSPEDELLAKEQIDRIFGMFKPQEDATLVLQAWREGMNGPEIIDQLGLPKNRYEAAVQKIRYHVK